MVDNARVAERLREAADLLRDQGANPFRVSAYRRAADTVEGSEQAMADILTAEGTAGLEALPAIGEGIAGAISEMVRTGRWSLLERLRGAVDPEDIFQRIPGVGPKLALSLHETLDVDSLEELELAAHDGRLETVTGVGPRRAAAIRANLDALLDRRPIRARGRRAAVPVAVLLDVDREYREAAAAGRLLRVAPRRFNPEGKAWLPILHTERDGWDFTAMFSNTARAHQLGRTDDWVVIDGHDQRHREAQHTVVTETRGPLEGRRVVRGREAECREHYAALDASLS